MQEIGSSAEPLYFVFQRTPRIWIVSVYTVGGIINSSLGISEKTRARGARQKNWAGCKRAGGADSGLGGRIIG